MNPVSTIPLGTRAPAKVRNVAITPGVSQLIVTWDASYKAASYEVECSESDAFPEHATQRFQTLNTSYTVTNLVNGTTYYVRVRAVC